MHLFISAPPNRRARRLVNIIAVATAAFTLAACSAPAGGTPDSVNRAYENEFGTVQLPENIERIVSVDYYTPAALVDLGVYPVGVVNSYFTEGSAIPEQYKSAIVESDAESIGEYYELNLEAVAQAKPDLIIATSDFLPLDDPLRVELEKVAPIVTFEARDGESWRTRATDLAEILGKEDKLQPLIEEYDDRRDTIKEKHSGILADETLAVFVPVVDEWATYADTHFSTPILRDLGANFRKQASDEINEAKFPNWFSYESLDRLSNADTIFVQPGNEEAYAALDTNTIWRNLPAVKNHMIFDYIPLSPTGSFGWASENLEDLDDLLTQVQAKIDAQG